MKDGKSHCLSNLAIKLCVFLKWILWGGDWTSSRAILVWNHICDFKSNSRCALVRFWNHGGMISDQNCMTRSSIAIMNLAYLYIKSKLYCWKQCWPYKRFNSNATKVLEACHIKTLDLASVSFFRLSRVPYFMFFKAKHETESAWIMSLTTTKVTVTPWKSPHLYLKEKLN